MNIRRIARVLGSVLVMLIALQGGAAVADHSPTVTASACVTDTEFRFHIQGNNVSVSKSVANNQSITGLAHSENFTVFLAISGVDTVNVVLDNGVGGSGNNWALGAFSHTITATRLSENDDVAFYNIVMDGVILHGTTPYVSGNVWPVARMLDKEMGFSVSATNIPITDCDPPPTSSTVPPTSSTVPPTSSTVPPTVAPTSIVSTTLAETTTIPEVETDIPRGDSTESVVPVLVAVGFLALVGATIRARRFER